MCALLSVLASFTIGGTEREKATLEGADLVVELVQLAPEPEPVTRGAVTPRFFVDDAPSCRELIPDLWDLTDHLHAGMQELLDAVG